MLEITQINNKIDFYIERKQSFFINANINFVNYTKLEKFMDFVKYAIKNKYKIIKAENKNDIIFFFISDKRTQNDVDFVYNTIDKMSSDSYTCLDVIYIEELKHDTFNKFNKTYSLDNVDDY